MDLTDRSKQFEQRMFELEELEQERRERLVREALGKFNFFLHFTAFISGCAYLVLLGILAPKAMPYVWIPIGLWTAGIACHFYRSFHPRSVAKRALESLDEQERDKAEQDQPDPDDDEGGDAADPAPLD